MRRGHEGPDVLHLHAGLALENEGGPRARVRVSRDGGFRARIVSGGTGQDFDRGGRLADGRRQKIEMLKQALIKTKLHGELQAQMAKDATQDAPPPRTFARGWLDGPDSDDRWSSFQ